MILFRGFSLIELMIVLAIIAILTAVGLPAYQTYVIRAKFAEVFSLSAPAQLAIAEFQQTTGDWPMNNQEAGIPLPDAMNGHYVKSISIQQNQVQALFNENAGSGVADQSVILSAELGNAGQILWDCYSLTIASYYLPANCR